MTRRSTSRLSFTSALTALTLIWSAQQTVAAASAFSHTFGTWTATATGAYGYGCAAVRLVDGNVLLAGTTGKAIPTSDLSAAPGDFDNSRIYEVASDKWTLTSPLHERRFGPTVTLLPNGKVLAAGGWNSSHELLSSAELYDPETVAREALAIRRKLLGTQHPEVARSLYALALVFSMGGKPAEAETLYREALAVFKNASGNQGPDVASTLNDLAYVLRSQSKMEEAEAVQREALGMQPKADQEFLDPLDRQELLKHVDQIVKVKGRLMSFGQARAGNYNYLHFSENCQAALSLAFHITDNPTEFRREAPQEYVDKTVIVEGQMGVHKGQAQIMIYSLAQIKVLDETRTPQ